MEDFIKKSNSIILKNEKIILILIFLISAIFISSLLLNIENQECQDSHWHMALAKNLAEGKGYTLDGKNPHGQYPPGFALLIMPFYWLTKNIHLSGLILVSILSIGTLFITYKVGKNINPLVGILSALFLTFHALFLFFSVSVMTEIPFMFFSMLGIYLFIKSFENPRYFLSAFPVLAFTFLIRYPGAVLIFPMAYISYVERKKIKKIISSDKFIIGLFLGILIICIWLIRNFIAFGDPFYSSYISVAHDITLQGFLNFSKLFFRLGFIFPFLVLTGMFFSIKRRDVLLKSFLFWFIGFFILHGAWWGGDVLRFYASILPVATIFASVGIIESIRYFKLNNKKSLALILTILILVSVSQLYIFFISDYHGNTIKIFNKYGSVQQISEWANKNMPESSNYLVSDIAVYSLYLDNENLFYYSEGINQLLKNELNRNNTFIFSESLHPWMTEPFLKGESGIIKIPLQNGKNVLVINTNLIKRIDYKDKYAILLNITEMEII